MKIVRLATCLQLPEPDLDAPLLLRALEAKGVRGVLAAWDDPHAWEGDAALTVLRSTWNYHRHLDAFLAWLETVPGLHNPLPVARWNARKRYLHSLELAGVPVVPTLWLDQGRDRLSLAAQLEGRSWGRAVFKPVVSAGSANTHAVDLACAAALQPVLDALVATRDVMLQPYLASVDGEGERSLVYLDGELSHSIRKAPRFSDGAESVSGAQPVAADMKAVADAALAFVRTNVHPEPLLYARVDLARDDAGSPVVMELELLEPSLFLCQHPPAAERFAAAIARRCS